MLEILKNPFNVIKNTSQAVIGQIGSFYRRHPTAVKVAAISMATLTVTAFYLNNSTQNALNDKTSAKYFYDRVCKYDCRGAFGNCYDMCKKLIDHNLGYLIKNGYNGDYTSLGITYMENTQLLKIVNIREYLDSLRAGR